MLFSLLCCVHVHVVDIFCKSEPFEGLGLGLGISLCRENSKYLCRSSQMVSSTIDMINSLRCLFIEGMGVDLSLIPIHQGGWMNRSSPLMNRYYVRIDTHDWRHSWARVPLLPQSILPSLLITQRSTPGTIYMYHDNQLSGIISSNTKHIVKHIRRFSMLICIPCSFKVITYCM